MRGETLRQASTGRRLAQGVSLLLFLGLLRLTAEPGAVERLAGGLPPDLYLRLDPLVALAVPAAAREWIPELWPGIALLSLSLVLGRIFCGYLCPFGITLDLARFLGKGIRARRTKPTAAPAQSEGLSPPIWHRSKYFLLFALLAAAAVGVNAVFLASPLPLITRFYATFIYPAAQLAGREALDLARPLFADSPLAYMQLPLRRFEATFFILGLFGALFVLEQFRPRFWCRYLCPAGALLGIFSLKPLWRRRVTRCVGCGQCRRRCPMRAMDDTGSNTAHQECIVCRRCESICPTETRFSCRSAPSLLPPQGLPVLPGRRRLLQAGVAGAGCALGSMLGLDSLQRPAELGLIRPGGLIRPPGAVPEEEFLRRCLRCGECMQACPSNALQPVYLLGGVAGLFSPVILPRRGPCESGCNACGRVCPTRALRPLPLEEKQRAKVGTAFVLRQKCLAWEQGKRCVVCQEICPYGAVSLRPMSDHSAPPSPVIRAERCFGCCACEHHCPVESPAIVVEAAGALRLARCSYITAAREAQLTLELTAEESREELPENALPPGFTE